MGLDMYAYTTRDHIPAVDFDEPADSTRLFYWRKHPDLHGWMEALYRAKGGGSEFNCVPVRLDREDLDVLEHAIKAKTLPETSGFSFGASDGSEMEHDLHFIRKARDALTDGLSVFYSSWW